MPKIRKSRRRRSKSGGRNKIKQQKGGILPIPVPVPGGQCSIM